LAGKLIAAKGPADHHKVVPGVFAQMKGANHQLAEEIVVKLLKQLKPREVLGAVQLHILSSTVAVQISAVELVSS
jgi:hypothetical protein